MLWPGKYLGGGTLLDDPAAFHDDDALGKTPHQIQVVGDQQHRHAVALLQTGQQIQNLAAQAHIQRRGGLIGQ